MRFEIWVGKRVFGQTFIHAKKKHRCVRFGHDGAVEVVEKITTDQIRVVSTHDPYARVRAMKRDMISLSSSPTFVVAEVQDSKNLLSRLQHQVERLEASVRKEKAVRKEVALQFKADLKILHVEIVATNVIVNEEFTICVK